jgi:hypothetical protein
MKNICVSGPFSSYDEVASMLMDVDVNSIKKIVIYYNEECEEF